MIEVREMNAREIDELLARVGYGHLACSLDDQPYLVPVHYAYVAPLIYIYTTEGKKSEIIDRNANVCLQVEDVSDNRHWKSAIVSGRAKRLEGEAKRQRALEAITKLNPTLTPAVSIHWMDNWVRENIEVIYSITPSEITGRASVPQREP
jgi:uncharacterized protein